MAEENSNSPNKEGGIHFKSAYLVQSVEKLFLDEKTADVHFIFNTDDGQKRIPAHKNVLALGNDVFKSMFYGGFKEVREIEVSDVSADAFVEFLRFFYSDNVTITIENTAEVMYLGDMYQMAGCLDICDKVIDEYLPINEVCTGLELAIKFKRAELQAKLEKKISEQPKIVFESDDFLKCSQDILKGILKIECLLCDATDVFDASLKWAEKACDRNGFDSSSMENRRRQLTDCLYLIPFRLMKSYQISSYADQYKNLFNKNEWLELFKIATSHGPIESELFLRTHIKSTTEWDETLRQRYDVNDLPEEDVHWLKQTETFEREDAPSVIGSIELNTLLRKCDNPDYTLSGILSVVKVSTEDCGSKEEIVLKQFFAIEFKGWMSTSQLIKLYKTIEFEKKISLHIRINFDSSWKENTFYTSKTLYNKLNSIVSNFNVNLTK